MASSAMRLFVHERNKSSDLNCDRSRCQLACNVCSNVAKDLGFSGTTAGLAFDMEDNMTDGRTLAMI